MTAAGTAGPRAQAAIFAEDLEAGVPDHRAALGIVGEEIPNLRAIRLLPKP
jgi:hypothetical protein